MKKIFEVCLGHPEEQSTAFAMLSLPATPCQIQDAKERFRFQNGENITLMFEDFAPEVQYLDSRLEQGVCGIDRLYLLNAAAEEIAQMNPAQQCALEGMAQAELEIGDPIQTARLYDLAASTSCCQVILSIPDDKSLGRYYVENGILTEYKDLPKDVLENLDYAKIGREAREAEGGVLLKSGRGYVVQDTEFQEASKEFVWREPDYSILLEVSDGGRPALLKLPAQPQEMDAVLDNVGAADWSHVSVRCADCIVPSLMDAITADANPAIANRAAQMLAGLSAQQITTYKAVLEAEGFDNLADALGKAGNLNQYTLSSSIAYPTDAAWVNLLSLLGEEATLLITPHLSLYDYGKSVMEHDGVCQTGYGALGRCDGTPIRAKESGKPEPPQATARAEAEQVAERKKRHDRKEAAR